MDRRSSRAGDYRTARIGASVGLGGVLALMVILDALVPSYDCDPVIVAALVGAIIALLGVAK